MVVACAVWKKLSTVVEHRKILRTFEKCLNRLGRMSTSGASVSLRPSECVTSRFTSELRSAGTGKIG